MDLFVIGTLTRYVSIQVTEYAITEYPNANSSFELTQTAFVNVATPWITTRLGIRIILRCGQPTVHGTTKRETLSCVRKLGKRSRCHFAWPVGLIPVTVTQYTVTVTCIFHEILVHINLTLELFSFRRDTSLLPQTGHILRPLYGIREFGEKPLD